MGGAGVGGKEVKEEEEEDEEEEEVREGKGWRKGIEESLEGCCACS
jgi:hypothetical protein